ncbi:hypothetical protein FBUS_02865 [Fasciolopsis buskii]|uniref:Uncharacterized protein n=1 Tax=Fasciolopsis buskii TaxID=27845 RepID=A0A8E0S3E6_9TREM|nr:hypothetical protein FBUS_02865 [Fasciolopsis buski]
MDDESFRKAFSRGVTEPPSGISAATFEDIIRKDKAKADFISKWTNLFNEGYENAPPVALRPTEEPRRSAVTSVSKTQSIPSHHHPTSLIPSDNRMEVLFSNLPDYWHETVVKYVCKHWNPSGRFASIYPILLRLEQELGPCWRLDMIQNSKEIQQHAVPNSTLNFHIQDDPYMYSIWREKVREH